MRNLLSANALYQFVSYISSGIKKERGNFGCVRSGINKKKKVHRVHTIELLSG